MKQVQNGTYILILYNSKGATIAVGSLGPVYFKKGFYAYVGSAMNKNGIFNRVGRHIRKDKPTRWHIDYPKFPVREVWLSDFGKKLEEEWANTLETLASDSIAGFGSTDTPCNSHLFYFKSHAVLKASRTEFCRIQNLKVKRFKMAFNLQSEPVDHPRTCQLTAT